MLPMSQGDRGQHGHHAGRTVLDAQRLKDNFARVAMHGDEVALFFYSDLFLRNPEVRDLFPVSMAVQRDRLLNALGRIVSDVDNLDSLVPYIQTLGRDHRKFGALADHYGAVGVSLIATLAHFSGPEWTDELAASWKEAYGLVAQVMTDSAKEDEGHHPPWWDATVMHHELRSPDIAVFRVSTSQPLTYEPGQSVAIESAERPRIWRFYSMANAPSSDAVIEFHVRMIAGGALSTALTRNVTTGAKLRLGPPVGELKLDTTSGRDVLLIAGSTGLAPLKALAEQIAALERPPAVQLFFGARSRDGLYDLPELEKMAARMPWLTVIPAVTADPAHQGEQGTLSDVVARRGPWHGYDAYVSGSTPMVTATARRLVSLGVPRSQILVEDFGWRQQ
jgi:NAD(P)H-flavin reductase/hemoglobin-like flavoprotein